MKIAKYNYTEMDQDFYWIRWQSVAASLNYSTSWMSTNQWQLGTAGLIE